LLSPFSAAELLPGQRPPYHTGRDFHDDRTELCLTKRDLRLGTLAKAGIALRFRLPAMTKAGLAARRMTKGGGACEPGKPGRWAFYCLAIFFD